VAENNVQGVQFVEISICVDRHDLLVSCTDGKMRVDLVLMILEYINLLPRKEKYSTQSASPLSFDVLSLELKAQQRMHASI